MKILMLAPQPFFEPRGTPFSILGRLRALSHLGHDVDLLTYHVGENVVIPGLRIFRTPAIRFIQEIPIGPSGIKLFLDILLLAKAFSLLLQKRYDLLHTHEEASFLGILLAKLFSIPHLYDMHSSLPQQLTNFRYTHFRPIVQLFEWLEHRVIKSSDAIITICPALEEHVKRINGNMPGVMIENVANEGDPEAIPEEDVRRIMAAYSLDGKEIVLYAGTFEPYQGLDLLIACAKEVLCRRQDVMFLLVGGKPEQVQHYQRQVRGLGLSAHFRFTGMRPMEEIPRFVKLSDILVSPRISGTNTPLKIYAYLQSGKPIVATDIQAHTQVLTPDVAVLVEPNPEALAKGIVSVLEDHPLAKRLGKQARELSENRYSLQEFIKKTALALDMAMR